MKRFIVFLFFIGLGGAAFALEARLGATAGYPGVYGVAATVEGGLELFEDRLTSEAGVETSWVGGTGRWLVPAGLAWESFLEEGLSVGAAVHGLGGADFGASLLKWGAEGELRLEYAWEPGVALGLSAGARYWGSQWEFPLWFVVEIPFGPEDRLEPWSGDAEKREAEAEKKEGGKP